MSINALTSDTEHLFSEGKAAAKRGDKVRARSLLTQVVEQEPHNEQAWMWLSGVVADAQEQQICLENVLVINPDNEQARKGLGYISARTGILPRVPEPRTAAFASADPPAAPPMNGFEVPEASSGYPFGGGGAPLSEMVAPWMQSPRPAEPVADPSPSRDQPQSLFGFPSSTEAAFISQPLVSNAAFAGPQSDVSPAVSVPEQNGTDPWPGMTDSHRPADSATAELPDPWALSGLSGPASVPGTQELTPDFSWKEPQAAPEQQFIGTGPETLTPHSDITTSFPEVDAFTPGGPGVSGAAPTSDAQTEVGFPGGGTLELPGWIQQAPEAPPVVPEEHNAEQESAQDPHISGPFGAAPFDPFAPAPAADMGPAGPYSAMQLPTPSELPGGDRMGGGSQPWYLQAEKEPQAPVYAPSGQTFQDQSYAHDVVDEHSPKKSVQLVSCPNCSEQVADTALACTNCGFSFFVNCPHCHELIDTGDARQGVDEPCPHCKSSINKMSMGRTGTGGSVPYTSEGLKSTEGLAEGAAMHHYNPAEMTITHRPAYMWVVDLLWSVVIVLMVWALTQLPTWLNLTGQY